MTSFTITINNFNHKSRFVLQYLGNSLCTRKHTLSQIQHQRKEAKNLYRLLWLHVSVYLKHFAHTDQVMIQSTAPDSVLSHVRRFFTGRSELSVLSLKLFSSSSLTSWRSRSRLRFDFGEFPEAASVSPGLLPPPP